MPIRFSEMNLLSRIVGLIVDHLPLWLWHRGNLYDVPGGSLHFCADHGRLPIGHAVRTIELARSGHKSRVIARGLVPFPFDHPDLEEFEKGDLKWGLIATWRTHRRHERGGTNGPTA